MKKLITLLAAVCLVVSMIPMTAFAAVGGDAQDDLDVTVQADPSAGGASQDDPEPREDGWYNDGGGWQYYYNNKPISGFRALPGKSKAIKYFFSASGFMKVGWRTINGKKYYFDKDGFLPETDGLGQMQKGWLRVSGASPDSFKTYYMDPKTGAQKTGKLLLNGNEYYLDPVSGVMATGWKEINGNTYYYNEKSGKKAFGWLKVNGYRYYLDPNSGRLKTGWQKIDGGKYYLDPDRGGKMRTGWLKLNGDKYYLDLHTGKMKTGLCTIKGDRYYLNPKNGKMKTGAVKIKKKLYFFKDSGKAYSKKGWFKYHKKKRYSYGRGRIASGIEEIGNSWYRFSNKTGALKETIGDDMDMQVYGKSSSTGYIVAVKRSWHEVRVYYGSSNHWSQSRSFTCTVGAHGSKTPKGTYTLGSRDKVQVNSGKTVCWYYCTRFSSSHQFQSILYKYDPANPPEPGQSAIYDGTLGGNVSNGDIRLSLDNAKWIYNNLSSGTKVVIK